MELSGYVAIIVSLCIISVIFIHILFQFSYKGITEEVLLHIDTSNNYYEWHPTGKIVKKEFYAHLPTKVNNIWVWRKKYYSYEQELSISKMDDSIIGGAFIYPEYSYEIIEQLIDTSKEVL